MGVLKRRRVFFSGLECPNDWGATFTLTGDHARPFATWQPADGLKLGKRLPHANQPGAAAGRVQDDIWQFPAKLLGQFEAHRFFALNAIRLLECREVEPAHWLAAFADEAAAVVDQAVHAKYLRAGEVRFLQVDHRRVVRHEHKRLHPGPRRIGGHRAPGVSGCGTGHAPYAQLIGHGNRHRHATRLEAASG